MRKPYNSTSINADGFGAFVCDITHGHPFSQFQYVEIQVHPTQVRIDGIWNAMKLHSQWFTDETVLNLCRGLCNGDDHVGQLADAIDECGGNEAIANYLRRCAIVLAEYFAFVERQERSKKFREQEQKEFREKYPELHLHRPR